MGGFGAYARTPLFWILLLALLLRIPGLLWGLPASDGWDDDGVAPRNFLVGIALTYAPGAFFTYPPLHMFLLALLALPGIAIALVKAHALDRSHVIATLIQVPYMTSFALIARLVSIAMSLGTIACIAHMAELVGGRRAAIFAALVGALNAAFTYYGVVTNLDGPEIFWCCLSLFFWMRLIIECEPKHVRWATLCAAAAVATKDQAYAAFVLSVPAGLIFWFAVDRRARQNLRKILIPLLTWSVISVLAVLLIDGAITNPGGFAKRLAFLTGPASRDYAEFAANGAGYLALFGSIWAHVSRFYPVLAIFLAALGIALHVQRFHSDPAVFVAGLLPLLAALSFTLTFNLVVMRTGNRFLLLQFVLLALYIGIASDWLVFAISPRPRLVFRALLVPLAAFALYQCLGIDAAFLFDPRYDVERWLALHTDDRATIETYGRNAFLPRFPSQAVVSRLDLIPLAKRNPQPGLREILAPPQAVEARRPHFIVINTFAIRDNFGIGARVVEGGRLQPIDFGGAGDPEARRYFRELYEGKLHYRLVHVAVFRSRFWQSLEGYQSLTQAILIFERTQTFASRLQEPNENRDAGAVFVISEDERQRIAANNQ